jgi:hypothetical protein
MKNLHNEKLVEKHAELVVEYCRMRSAHNAHQNCTVNPYHEHLSDAIEALPQKMSIFAAQKANAIISDCRYGVSGYMDELDDRFVTPRGFAL